MAKTTLKDISKALNISISTVSKALSDSYEISDRTKKLVQEYATEISFNVVLAIVISIYGFLE